MSTMSFYLPKNEGNRFWDLSNLFIHLNMKPVTNDFATITAKDVTASTSNSILHSLFSDVTISINDVTVLHMANYDLLAYHHMLYNISPEIRKTQGYNVGWADDTAFHFDFDATEPKANAGFVRRMARFTTRQKVGETEEIIWSPTPVYFVGCLFHPFTTPIPSGCSIRIDFVSITTY